MDALKREPLSGISDSGVKVFLRRAQGKPLPNLVRVSPSRQLVVQSVVSPEAKDAPLAELHAFNVLYSAAYGLVRLSKCGALELPLPRLVNPVSVKRHHPAPIEARKPLVAKSVEISGGSLRSRATALVWRVDGCNPVRQNAEV